jgi:hypothetical protein
VDLTHNWSVGGRTRHVEVRQYFLRDLKEENVIVAKWISGDNNSSDMFTKNLGGPLFEKDLTTYCGDEVAKKIVDFVALGDPQWKGV